ncbi:6-aminohexanoate-dimer hydrolase [Enhygromyxa salina]|uniref:6-aminohexanoate-dimer hydrolase n=1 Tax=Enhygromyxa salina TaxID=215803 RepID=A0A2S9XY15_9BACT|nr:serine hydrolase [Enhygromyxa salina]PRP97621.1 6-aminohexanoate-dimer hydrolase [Enhygromyxa salina]
MKLRWTRKPRLKKIVLAVLAINAVIVIGVASWLVGWIFPIATGAVAKAVCSDVFVAGRESEGLVDEEFPKAFFVSYEVDPSAQVVRADALGFAAKTAAYRPGLGCALALEVGPASLRAEGFEPTPRPAGSETAPWPRGDGPLVEPPSGDPPGLDRAALELAIDEIFPGAGASSSFDGPPLNTRAVVVVWAGQLIAERYAEGFDADTPQLGWSMTKSVTSALVGILVARGELSIDEPIGFGDWLESKRGRLTWDQLLRMSSGLEFDESYGLRTDVTVMLYDRHDASALPLGRQLADPIDTRFAYSSGTTNLISRRIRELFADDGAYHRFPHDALFVPLGMHSAVMETDPSGTFVGSSFMYATPRDWARFGLLYLHDGVWDGERILPEGWVARSVAPTPTDPSAGYGLQWWLNAAPDPEQRALPGVPPDAYFASGHQGQIVLVVPSRDAVIVRLGMTNGRKWPRAEFAAAVLAALPE